MQRDKNPTIYAVAEMCNVKYRKQTLQYNPLCLIERDMLSFYLLDVMDNVLADYRLDHEGGRWLLSKAGWRTRIIDV